MAPMARNVSSTAGTRRMCAASRSTIGSSSTDAATAATAHEIGRWAATNTSLSTTSPTMVPTMVSAAAPVRRYDRRSTVPVALGIPPYRTDGELAVRGGWQPRRARAPVQLVDVHPASVAVIAAAAALAAAVWAIVTIAPDMVTKVAVGVVLGVALSPLSANVQRRFGRSRIAAAGIVGGGVVLFFAAVVLLVAPPAVEQASDFSEELPATVRDLYSWPIVGDRLEEADAAGEVEEAIADLPARIDDQTLAEFGERLLGGAFSTRRGRDRRHRRAGRRRGDRPPRPGRGAAVAPGAGRRDGPHRLPLLRQLLRRLAARRGAQRPLRPHRRPAARRAPRAHRGHLGRAHQPHPADRWLPRRRVLRAARPHGEPDHGRDRRRCCSSATSSSRTTWSGPAIVGSAVNLTPPATMLAALIGGAAAGVPGALVATPLLGAGKALYLESRGKLPPRRDAALRRRLKARLDQREAGGRRAHRHDQGVNAGLATSGRPARQADAHRRAGAGRARDGRRCRRGRARWRRRWRGPRPLPPWWRLRDASAR